MWGAVMKRNEAWTKTLAGAGTLLVWSPLVTMAVFAVSDALAGRTVRVDYLLPAEFFPVVAVGGLLLLWAASRAHDRRAWIGWGLGLAFGALIAVMVYTQLTGLASGRTEAEGPVLIAANVLLGLYTLTLPEMGTGGILLLKDLFSHRPKGDRAALT